MRILFITHRLPYSSVKHAGGYYQYSLIKALKSRGINVDLLSFVNDEELKHIEEISKEVDRVFTVSIKKSKLEKVCHLPLLLMRPRFIVQAWKMAMAKKIIKLVNTYKYDWIQFEYTQMAQYKKYVNKIPTSIMEHDISIIPVKRAYEKEKSLSRKILKYFTYILIRINEPIMISKFDLILVFSEKDKKYISKIIKNKPIYVLSPPVPSLCQNISNNNSNKNILFIGDLSRNTNIEAILWFYNNVFAKLKEEIPGVIFTIAGSNPNNDIIQLSEDKSVKLLTNFERIETLYSNARVFVSPLFVGGGIIKKNLDSLALGCPVVTTSIGNEGINAPSPEVIIIADDANTFLKEVRDICLNDTKRNKLSIAGIKFVNESFNWERSVNLLIEEYQRILICKKA